MERSPVRSAFRSLVAGLALFATAAFAQFPNKPVTIVVGFEPGGGTDTTARIVQGPLGEQIGQQVVVDPGHVLREERPVGGQLDDGVVVLSHERRRRPDSEALPMVIMIHGRGDSAQGILSLAGAFRAPGLAFVAPEARRNVSSTPSPVVADASNAGSPR